MEHTAGDSELSWPPKLNHFSEAWVLTAMLSSKRPSPAPEGELRASLNKGQRFATTFRDLEKAHRLQHCQSPLRGRNALASFLVTGRMRFRVVRMDLRSSAAP